MNAIAFSYHLSAILSGCIIAIGFAFAFFRFDDLLFDIAFWFVALKRARQYRGHPKLSVAKLRSKPEQRIAIFIPCWREFEVVDRMLDFACRSIEYRHYDIFVGVYPNDPETLECVARISERYPQVHAVVNDLDGPTTKAQNLNAMFRGMSDYEGKDPYQIIVLHDTEDIIHVLSLLMYNYLMPASEMVQLPVFPLERPWHKWTAWTYSDEFAQNHLKDMVFREQIGGFVPSAGVGCAFSRPALDIVQATSDDIFPRYTLTEDYQIALRLHNKGLKTIFVHQQLARAGKHRPATAASYVATRAFFPDTLKAAIRQKSRWVAGICFQAWHMTGWTGNFATRYGLYRDRKSIVANVMVFAGYVVLVSSFAMFVWQWFDPNAYVPNVGSNRIVWWVLDFVLIMTLIDLLQSAFFVAWVYGPLQGALAIVRPPIAAYINGIATFRAAYAWYRSQTTGKPMLWSKTAHVFPTEQALAEFRRQIGQILVDQDKLSNSDLHLALEEQRHSRESLGDALVRMGFVKERDVVEAFAEQTGSATALEDDLIPDLDALALLTEDLARRLGALPLRLEHGSILLVVSRLLTPAEETELRTALARPFELLLAEKQRVAAAIDRSYLFNDERRKPLGRWLMDRKYLDRDALQRMLVVQRATDKPLLQILSETGTIDGERLYDVLQDYFGVQTENIDSEPALSDLDVARLPAGALAENEITFVRGVRGLTIASAFPLKPAMTQRFAAAFGEPVQPVVARKAAVLRSRHLLLERAAALGTAGSSGNAA